MVLLMTVIVFFAHSAVFAADDAIAIVDSVKLRESDLRALATVKGISVDDDIPNGLLGQLVDRHLISRFLVQKRVSVRPEDVDRQLAVIYQTIRKNNRNPVEVLSSLRLSENRIRQELAVPLGWQLYIDQTISEAQITAYYQQNVAILDGRRARAFHLLLKISADAPESVWQAKKHEIEQIRHGIVEGKYTFEEAVAKYSEAPSRTDKGDLGFFGSSGRVPQEISAAVLPAKAHDLLPVIRTSYGLHLVKVVEIQPGNLTQEDVRQQIVSVLGQRLWEETLIELRKNSKIEILLGQ